MEAQGRSPIVKHTNYIRVLLSLNAFPMTETELKLIAAAAKIGLSSMPKNG